MMFVASETTDPTAETVSLIENIVKAQVIHLVGTTFFLSQY